MAITVSRFQQASATNPSCCKKPAGPLYCGIRAVRRTLEFQHRLAFAGRSPARQQGSKSTDYAGSLAALVRLGPQLSALRAASTSTHKHAFGRKSRRREPESNAVASSKTRKGQGGGWRFWAAGELLRGECRARRFCKTGQDQGRAGTCSVHDPAQRRFRTPRSARHGLGAVGRHLIGVCIPRGHHLGVERAKRTGQQKSSWITI